MNALRALFFTNYPTFRQWIQVVAAAVLYALVAHQILPAGAVSTIVTFIAACLPPALSVFNSASGLRTFTYTLVLAGQAVILLLPHVSPLTVDSIVNIVLAAIGAGTAVTHTPTPLAASVGRHAKAE